MDYPIYGSPMVYRWLDKAAGKDELMGGMGFNPFASHYASFECAYAVDRPSADDEN